MNRREFVQQFVLKNSKRAFDSGFGEKVEFDKDACRKTFESLVSWGNSAYNTIEQDEKIAEDNSMPDTRGYLEQVTGANGHG